MRETKYRQWIKSSKEFHYWGHIIDHPLVKDYGRYFQSPLGPMDNDKRESQQYTGLKDKNGKEIYEGDILQYPDSEIQEVVKWKKNMWTEEGYMTGFGEFTFTPDQYEIIGNIYENPELLNNQIKEEKLKEE